MRSEHHLKNNQTSATSLASRIPPKTPSLRPKVSHGAVHSTQDYLTFHYIHSLPNAHDYPYVHHHPKALDHILNQTLITLPLSQAKTPAARYTNRRTAPTVHKALHLLIHVQYLRSVKRGSRTRASIFADTSRNSFVSRPTSPKTQFTSAEAHGTFARRVDSASIIDVSANASGSEQGQATGKRGKTSATNVTLRGGGADYAYPIGKVPGLRSGAGTPEPGESDTRPGNDRLLPRLVGGMGRPPTVG